MRSTRYPLYVKVKIFDILVKQPRPQGVSFQKLKCADVSTIWPPLWIFVLQLVNINTIYLSAKFGGNWVTITTEISNYIFGHVTVSKR